MKAPQPEPLDDRLRLHVGEVSASAAAVRLLIAHRAWLTRADFLDAFTFICTDFDTELTSTGIEWDQAGFVGECWQRLSMSSGSGWRPGTPTMLTSSGSALDPVA